jgi:hypothetical protein
MTGTFQDALLRSTSRELINVFDLAYSRAVSLNELHRVRLDQKSGHYSVEKNVNENGRENFVPADDVSGGKGDLDSRITIEFRPPGEIVPEPATQTGAALPDDGSPMNDSPASEVAIVFYPDGTADAGDIVLRDKQGFRLSLRINPITARVHIIETKPE